MTRLALACLLALASASPAAQENFAAGAQAAPWLRLSNNARFTAMGEAGVAEADDVNAASLNPAGLAHLKGQQASFMHHAYVMDAAVEHLAYGLALQEGLGLALSLDYVNFGKIDKVEVQGGQVVQNGSFNPSGMHVDLGAGYALAGFDLGANLKYISQSLDGAGGSSVAADLGGQWRQAEEGLALGATVQNLGGQLDGASLPMNAKLGAAYGLGLGQAALSVAADLNLPFADTGASSFGAGFEYKGGDLYALRAGYKAVGNNGAAGLSAGGGLSVSTIRLDYAYSAVGVLGNSHQVSALIRF